MKDIKYLALIIVLCVVILFLFMDKCGSSRKLDNLKGQYEEASKIAKVERLIKEETIKEQQREIEALNTTIEVKNTTIAKKEKSIVGLEEQLGELERDFVSLQECQEQYNKLVEAFTLCKSASADKDDVIFSLNEKYDAQLKISNSYKDMYETLQANERNLQKIVTAQDWQIKKLKLTSGLKTGIGLGLLGLVIYGVLK